MNLDDSASTQTSLNDDSPMLSHGREGERHAFSARLVVDRSIDEVFAFFSDAANLERITPPFLHFQVLTPTPVAMRRGTLIDYRLKLRGVPMRWRSEITVWDPPHRFVDEQCKGPYFSWRHEHRFEEKAGRTWVFDHVVYDAPGGALARRLFIRPDLERIFLYRLQKLQTLFDGPNSP